MNATTPSPAAAARWLPIALLVIPFFLLGLGIFTRYLKERMAPPPVLPIMGEVPDFRCIERSGLPISRDDLKGRLWVASFVFTHCGGPCPAMCAQLADLQKTIKHKVQDIRLVSFTLDPENDTPQVLKLYGERFGADPNKWLFLTGDKEKIQQLATQGFKLSALEGQDGVIVHSTHFVLVDNLSRIRGYYAGTDADALNKLRDDIEKLIQEAKR
ncbi:MAG: SCO family protein [Planctomycetes bacterium]|nr:SCO family protein [Planctomycetota bacterium]